MNTPHPPANALPSSVGQIRGGSPTPAELAALTTVIVALRRQPPAPHPPTISAPTGWRSHWDAIRAAQLPGPGGWR